MLSQQDVGDYRILKGTVLGTGAFATVWKGYHKNDITNEVAIKAIKKKNFLKSQQLLSKEITILKELSSLHHKNVVGLLDCVELKDEVCLVMEFCNGGDLADMLHKSGTLSEDTLCAFVKQIAEAMKALQQKGIVHRDLKPQNILLCYQSPQPPPHPSQYMLKIADFGFARFIGGDDMATTLCGSPMYMAPEVIMSVKYTAKADLWSIGTILYQCLTGRAPFQAQNPQELKKKYEKNPGLKPNIPSSTSPQLRDLLMKMLKRDAEERIAFEEFFNHAFLKLNPATPPLAMPAHVRRRSSSSSVSSTPSPSRGSPAVRRRAVTEHQPSPPTQVTPTPTPVKIPEVKEEDMVTTLTEAAGFTKVEKLEEDFVMVPEAHTIDSDGEEGVNVRKAPLAETEMSLSPHKSPHKATKAIKIHSGEAVTFSKDKNAPSSTSRPVTLDPSPLAATGNNRIAGSSPEGASMKRKMQSPEKKPTPDPSGQAVVRRGQEGRGSSEAVDGVDVDFSPPAVQFMVGTPPTGSGMSWKRNSVVTPPPGSIARSLSSQALQVSASSPLPPILGSPTKPPAMFHITCPTDTLDNCPEPVQAPFAAGRLPSTGEPMDTQHISTGSSVLSSQLTNNNMPGALPHRSSRERLSSAGSRERLTSVGSMDEQGMARRGSLISTSPPHGSHSPLRFVPQPLSEETLMDDQHCETLGKLSFVLDLVECVLDLARGLGSPFSVPSAQEPPTLAPHHLPQYRTSQRSLEQLVLYARACHLLNSGLHMARDQIRNDRLQHSTTLRSVLGEMNMYYHHVVDRCKALHQEFTANCRTPLTHKLVMATADKLIYNQAIHMCQSAALDEFSQSPTESGMAEVIRRYQVAQILLHSLAQTARNDNDKCMLVKYRRSVEGRLSVLTSEGSQGQSNQGQFDRHRTTPNRHSDPMTHLDNRRFQVHS